MQRTIVCGNKRAEEPGSDGHYIFDGEPILPRHESWAGWNVYKDEYCEKNNINLTITHTVSIARQNKKLAPEEQIPLHFVKYQRRYSCSPKSLGKEKGPKRSCPFQFTTTVVDIGHGSWELVIRICGDGKHHHICTGGEMGGHPPKRYKPNGSAPGATLNETLRDLIQIPVSTTGFTVTSGATVYRGFKINSSAPVVNSHNGKYGAQEIVLALDKIKECARWRDIGLIECFPKQAWAAEFHVFNSPLAVYLHTFQVKSNQLGMSPLVLVEKMTFRGVTFEVIRVERSKLGAITLDTTSCGGKSSGTSDCSWDHTWSGEEIRALFREEEDERCIIAICELIRCLRYHSSCKLIPDSVFSNTQEVTPLLLRLLLQTTSIFVRERVMDTFGELPDDTLNDISFLDEKTIGEILELCGSMYYKNVNACVKILSCVTTCKKIKDRFISNGGLNALLHALDDTGDFHCWVSFAHKLLPALELEQVAECVFEVLHVRNKPGLLYLICFHPPDELRGKLHSHCTSQACIPTAQLDKAFNVIVTIRDMYFARGGNIDSVEENTIELAATAYATQQSFVDSKVTFSHLQRPNHDSEMRIDVLSLDDILDLDSFTDLVMKGIPSLELF
ncbi:TKL protein kinase [Phytophthora megakarya]|uniref:TKL protein kinase n=1 Tax=Phytophthora megakarya TaxID=4795 RepID=A0A225WU14_9STRA|nr:TKL protein kinase [Phytophthora megakarya]